MDYSFLQFFKNDFDKPRLAENLPVSTLDYKGFIVQKPNETFAQITNSSISISFAGGILVELVDYCGTVKQNITSQFFWSNFTDKNGIIQMRYEFGNIGVDYYTEPLYIKITDLVNANIYYSTALFVTNYYNRLSTLAYYWDVQELNGIPYDIAPLMQSIRFVGVYKNDINDTESNKQYTKYDGGVVAYRSIITDQDVYKCDNIDIFTFRRLQRMFQSPFVYLNGQRVELIEIKKETRLGDSNLFQAEFTVNPKNEFLTLPYQLYLPLRLISLTPANNSVVNSTTTIFSISGQFSSNVTLGSGTISVYDSSGLIETFTPSNIFISGGDTFTCTFTIPLTAIENYSVVISSGLFISGAEIFGGVNLGDWEFSIQSAQYDSSDYNSDYLI